MEKEISYLDLGASLVGIIDCGAYAVVIDSGISPDHAKKISNAAAKPIKTVLLTHMHADHAGGASYLAERGAAVYISKYEISFLFKHELNTALLYGGVPGKMYRRPFFRSESIAALPFEPDTAFSIGGREFLPITTDGHSIGHTAFLTGKTLFIGDALTSPKVIAKHKLIYNYCPRRALATLDRIKDIDFSDAVLCHKEVIDKITAVKYALLQKEHILEIYSDIRTVLSDKPVSAQSVTHAVCEKRGLPLSQDSALLALSAVKGYLSDMEDMGEISAYFENGEIVFGKIS
jgi:glyoxylase-like metal-dependent hydrolase (beta-lactamase superfamily II)